MLRPRWQSHISVSNAKFSIHLSLLDLGTLGIYSPVEQERAAAFNRCTRTARAKRSPFENPDSEREVAAIGTASAMS